ncbi:hypothetical protein FRX31_003095, partial [Thalictrum thalictroides]
MSSKELGLYISSAPRWRFQSWHSEQANGILCNKQGTLEGCGFGARLRPTKLRELAEEIIFSPYDLCRVG